MKKLIPLLALFLLITSCSTTKQNINTNQTKWLNTNIKGNYLPEKPSLKDDFYQAVNYEKFTSPARENIINEGNAYEANIVLLNQMTEVLKNGESTNPEHQILHNFYNQFVDWDKRNADGLKPVIPYIQKVNNVQTLDEFEALFNDEVIRNYMPFFLDFQFSPVVLINFYQLFYKKDAATDFYEKMLLKSGFTKEQAEQIINNVIEMEEKLFFDESQIYMTVPYVSLEELFMNYPVKKYLNALNLPEEMLVYNFNYMICNPERVKIADSMYNQQELEKLKSHIICKMLFYASSVTDKEAFDLYNEFSRQLNGANNYENDDFTVVNYLNDRLPLLLGKIWVQEYFPNQLKTETEQLIMQIVEEYKAEVQTWKWVSESMKFLILQMLDNATIIVGPTDGFNDYSKIDICKKNLFESSAAIANYKLADDSKISVNSKDDPTVTFMSPQTYNAYCNATSLDKVQIVVLPGFIIGQNFTAEMSYEEKLGTIGSVMGHEISHIFVTNQQNGNFLSSLWKSEDLAVMQKVLQPLINQMDTMEVLPGKYYIGQEKIAEMGADYFGVYTMLSIARKIPDFNYELFFQTYARSHYTKSTFENIENLFIDRHPMSYLRANMIVQQFDEFYETYGIKKGDGMYLAPGKRVRF